MSEQPVSDPDVGPDIDVVKQPAPSATTQFRTGQKARRDSDRPPERLPSKVVLTHAASIGGFFAPANRSPPHLWTARVVVNNRDSSSPRWRHGWPLELRFESCRETASFCPFCRAVSRELVDAHQLRPRHRQSAAAPPRHDQQSATQQDQHRGADEETGVAAPVTGSLLMLGVGFGCFDWRSLRGRGGRATRRRAPSAAVWLRTVTPPERRRWRCPTGSASASRTPAGPRRSASSVYRSAPRPASSRHPAGWIPGSDRSTPACRRRTE